MIDESIGKILGMAMAYGVSALGLFLAYANYRKRTLKAEKVMTPKAWGVVAAVLLTIVGGVLVVAELAKPPAPADLTEGLTEDPTADLTEDLTAEQKATEAITSMDFEEPDSVRVVTEASGASEEASGEAGAQPDEERARWPLIGMLLPAIIFLSATWITAGLYRHFSAGDGTRDASQSAAGD